MAFTSFGLSPQLVKATRELGYTRPTPIQEQAIGPAMEGRDVLACAMTGSGKTAAFLLPIIHHLMPLPRGITRALILAPTRELAAQIHQALEGLAAHTPVTGAPVFGGVGMNPQEHAFRSGVDIIIATPGRLLDHFRQPYAKLEHVEYLVLDEADRMLDMGFLPDIRRVMKHIPTKRQTMFFSATMPNEIVRLSADILKQPVATINIERKSAPAVGITQAVYPVPRELKSGLLLELLSRDLVHDAIVFCRTKHRANRLGDYLTKHGISNAKIHGNRSQAQRTAALAGFKDGSTRVLVATDIVARGIDVEELGHVINFDVPGQPEDYIHRVGRTARAEATGDAFTFVSPEEEGELRDIERAVGHSLPRITLPDFDYSHKPAEKFEIPIGERIAQIRAKKAEDRARSKAKQERKGQPQSSAPPARGRNGSSPRGGPVRPAATVQRAPAVSDSTDGDEIPANVDPRDAAARRMAEQAARPPRSGMNSRTHRGGPRGPSRGPHGPGRGPQGPQRGPQGPPRRGR